MTLTFRFYKPTKGEPHTANIGLLQAGRTVVNQSVVHLIYFSACGQLGASNAPPDNKPETVSGNGGRQPTLPTFFNNVMTNCFTFKTD